MSIISGSMLLLFSSREVVAGCDGRRSDEVGGESCKVEENGDSWEEGGEVKIKNLKVSDER